MGDRIKTTRATAAVVPQPRYATGEVLDGVYELRGLLGEGGMARVFEAWDRRLNRTVAVKVPHDHATGARLRLEAQALAAIRHPSLVTVYALGGTDQHPFLVMEKIVGVTMEEHLERRGDKPFGTDEVLELLIPVGEGLEVVHRAGIAHRDLKPSNIMMCGRRVVLMDFGLVLPEYDSTAAQHVVGSPAYMAPEVIKSSVVPGGAYRSDIYAFGILAFEVLDGGLPYDADNIPETLVAHITGPVPTLHERRPDLPRALSDLVAQCMRRNPEERPDNMEQVLWRLRDVRNQRPLHDETQFSVLVVDDDEDVGLLCEAVVDEHTDGALVTAVNRAEDALDALAARVWDVLVLDMQLPGMSGVELAMYLHGSVSVERTLVIGISGRARAEDVALLAQIGVTHFVEKGPEFTRELWNAMRPRAPA